MELWEWIKPVTMGNSTSTESSMEFTHSFFKQPSPLWDEVLSLRLSVFVEEMNVPVELEVDEFDSNATHLCLKSRKEMLGTLRLVTLEDTQHSSQNSTKHIKLGRVAVHADFRRQGVGRHMMQLAIDYGKKSQCSKIILGSQIYITNFYQSLGFIKQGDIFDDAGIPHITMTLDI